MIWSFTTRLEDLIDISATQATQVTRCHTNKVSVTQHHKGNTSAKKCDANDTSATLAT